MINKQTAVSWLIHNIVDDQIDRAKPMSEWLVIFDKAKAMEKEQIIEAYREGRTDQQTQVPKFYNRSSAFYYTSTYGQ